MTRRMDAQVPSAETKAFIVTTGAPTAGRPLHPSTIMGDPPKRAAGETPSGKGSAGGSSRIARICAPAATGLAPTGTAVPATGGRSSQTMPSGCMPLAIGSRRVPIPAPSG